MNTEEVMSCNEVKLKGLNTLIDVLNKVREGCPWDKEQTEETLKMLTVEECYELVDAVTVGDWENIKEELGDILMHIFFYSRIAEEKGLFTIGDVAQAVSDKLVYRHPHVFGTIEVNSTSEVLTNWEKLKKKKRKEGGVLSGVPDAMPALIKAYRMQQKAASVGFEWKEKQDVWLKVTEEIEEVNEALSEGSCEHIEEEFGDLLFAVINAARIYGVDAENALEKTNRKFKKRFEYIEHCCKRDERELDETDLDTLESYWCEAKEQL